MPGRPGIGGIGGIGAIAAPKPGGGKGGGGAAIFVNLDIILNDHSMNQSYGFLFQEF